MGRKEDDGVERIEGGVVVVNPKPRRGITAKAIDLLEWGIVKLMHDSSKPLHYLQGNFALPMKLLLLMTLLYKVIFRSALMVNLLELVQIQSLLRLLDITGLMGMA